MNNSTASTSIYYLNNSTVLIINNCLNNFTASKSYLPQQLYNRNKSSDWTSQLPWKILIILLCWACQAPITQDLELLYSLNNYNVSTIILLWTVENWINNYTASKSLHPELLYYLIRSTASIIHLSSWQLNNVNNSFYSTFY